MGEGVDFCGEVIVFCCDFLVAEFGEFSEWEVEEVFGLGFVEVVLFHDCFFGLGVVICVADEMDEVIEVVEGVEESFEEMYSVFVLMFFVE